MSRIAVTHVDNDNIEHYQRYDVSVRQLLCTSWDGVDYKWAFNELEKILNLPKNSIISWRVI